MFEQDCPEAVVHGQAKLWPSSVRKPSSFSPLGHQQDAFSEKPYDLIWNGKTITKHFLCPAHSLGRDIVYTQNGQPSKSLCMFATLGSKYL